MTSDSLQECCEAQRDWACQQCVHALFWNKIHTCCQDRPHCLEVEVMEMTNGMMGQGWLDSKRVSKSWVMQTSRTSDDLIDQEVWVITFYPINHLICFSVISPCVKYNSNINFTERVITHLVWVICDSERIPRLFTILQFCFYLFVEWLVSASSKKSPNTNS